VASSMGLVSEGGADGFVAALLLTGYAAAL
jgi:hypothetical protein